MTVQIAHTGAGFQAYRTENAIRRTPVGPVWPLPHEAIAYVDLLEAVPATSPLRVSAEPSPPIDVPPHRIGPRWTAQQSRESGLSGTARTQL